MRSEDTISFFVTLNYLSSSPGIEKISNLEVGLALRYVSDSSYSGKFSMVDTLSGLILKRMALLS